MKEESVFFTSPNTPVFCPGKAELIHSSTNGWSELYRIEKDGRYFIHKALKKEFRDDMRYEMFLRKEFEIGRSLSHVFICEVYDLVISEELGCAIEMEWIDGCTLSDFLEKESPDQARRKRLALQLCDAFSYIHRRQVLHRDIKPSNIIITRSGEDVKIIDFGISDTASHTILKTAAGTESYAAPEVLSGKTPTIASDIYSLGKVLSCLIPSERSIIQHCLEEKPEDRFQDVEEIKNAILRGNRRKPVILTSIAVLIAILCLVFGLSRKVGHQAEDIPLQPAPTASTPVTEDSEEISMNPEDIDDLFNQATDLILSKEP